jgi:hypothetical protein
VEKGQPIADCKPPLVVVEKDGVSGFGSYGHHLLPRSLQRKGFLLGKALLAGKFCSLKKQ